MKHENVKAIILKRTNFQEADRIITLLTETKGKVRVMAKGVRKQKSKLAGGLELLSVSDISYIISKSEIYTVMSTRLVEHYSEIVKDIDKTMAAYKVLGNINKLCEDHSGQEFFEDLIIFLQYLNDKGSNVNQALLWHGLRLLSTTGHAPNLMTDSTGVNLVAGKNYSFNIEAMSFAYSTSRNFNEKHIKLLRILTSSLTPETNLYENVGEFVSKNLRLVEQLCKYHLNI